MLALFVGPDKATGKLSSSNHGVLILRLERDESLLTQWAFAFESAPPLHPASEAQDCSASLLRKVQNLHHISTSLSRRQTLLSFSKVAFLQCRKSACWAGGTLGLIPLPDIPCEGEQMSDQTMATRREQWVQGEMFM